MIFEFRHVAVGSVAETMYLVVSLNNGAPGSSSTVRVDHASLNNLIRGAPEQDASATFRHRTDGSG
jgi:hypothetical protein